MAFKKAEKSKSNLKLAISAPSGGGKTYTALRIATGIAKKINSKIAVIDTEHGSASLYADKFEFDVLEMDKPFTVQKYIDAIKEAEVAGYKVLIIDSSTHGWQEILDHVEKITQTKFRGNSYRAWAEGTPMYQEWIDAMLCFNGHTIVTMRSKTEYAMESINGKTQITKVGMGTENRKGIEYEFTMVMEGTCDHIFNISKDRTSKYQDQIIDRPKESFGEELIDWLNAGKAVEVKEVKIDSESLLDRQESLSTETIESTLPDNWQEILDPSLKTAPPQEKAPWEDNPTGKKTRKNQTEEVQTTTGKKVAMTKEQKDKIRGVRVALGLSVDAVVGLITPEGEPLLDPNTLTYDQAEQLIKELKIISEERN